MLLRCMYVRNPKPRSYRELSDISSSQVGTENKAGDCLHPVLRSQDQARLSAIAIRIVTALTLLVDAAPPPACFHAAAFFSTAVWLGWQLAGGGEWSETNIEPSVRLTLFDLCATAAVAPYRLLKSDARRMHLLRPTCTPGRCYRGAAPPLHWLGGMILLHACVTSSSPCRSASLHLRVFKSLTLPETVRMEHFGSGQAVL